MKKKTHLVRNRCLFSIVVILVYFLCHRIPLNGIDMSEYNNAGLDLGAILTMAVSGAGQKCYVMSLGISPYITASLLISILFAMRSKEARARTSPKAMNYWITGVCFVVTLAQSIFYALSLKYVEKDLMSILVVIFELMAGASIAQYLLINNKKYGVGGFAPIIIVNMTESLIGLSIPEQSFRRCVMYWTDCQHRKIRRRQSMSCTCLPPDFAWDSSCIRIWI